MSTLYQHLTEEAAVLLGLKRYILLLFILSVLTNCVLSLWLFLKKDDSRTIVLSPGADTAYVAQSDRVSANLLERFTVTAVTLITNMTPATADFQTARFLENVAPESWKAVKALLDESVTELQKTKASVAFFPQAVQVTPEEGSVCLTGERRVMIGSTVTSSAVVTLCAGTVVRAGRLWITQLTQKP